jgi:hypothetical protein
MARGFEAFTREREGAVLLAISVDAFVDTINDSRTVKAAIRQ